MKDPISDIGRDIAGGAPDVSPGAPTKEKTKAATFDDRWKHLKDKHGRSFDPSFHQRNADGAPKLSSKGRLQGIPGRALPPPSKSEAGLPPPERSAPPDPQSTPAAGRTDPGEEHLQAASVVVESIVGIASMVFGPEWQPQRTKHGKVTIDERDQMVRAWALYFEARGVSDVPPEVLVGVTMIGYVAPRMAAESTRSKISTGWARLRGWFRRRRGASTDLRDNDERENNAGATARSGDASTRVPSSRS